MLGGAGPHLSKQPSFTAPFCALRRKETNKHTHTPTRMCTRTYIQQTCLGQIKCSRLKVKGRRRLIWNHTMRSGFWNCPSPGFLQIWRCNWTPVRQESCNFPCSTGKARHQTTRMWTSREDAQDHQDSLSLFPSVEKKCMQRPWYTKDYPGAGNNPADKHTPPQKKSLISGAYILMGSHRKPSNQVSKISSIWDAVSWFHFKQNSQVRPGQGGHTSVEIWKRWLPCISLGKCLQAQETRWWKRPEVGIVWCVLAQRKREACPRAKVTLDTVRSCALPTEGDSGRFWTHKRHGLIYILPRSLWGYIQENNTTSGCLHSTSYVTRTSNY